MVTDNPPPTDAPANSDGGGVNSPHSRRPSLPSPWASIVRGDFEQQNPSPADVATAVVTPAAAPTAGAPAPSPPVDQTFAPDHSAAAVMESSGSESFESSSSNVNGVDNATILPRPAWNRPSSNGVTQPPSVMGGTASWPALSEVRAVTRSPSDNPTPIRPVSDGSVTLPKAPLISPPPQRPATNIAHGNSTGNNSMSSRPRFRRGSSSGSGPSHNTYNPPVPQMPPPFPVFDAPYSMMPPAVIDNSIRGARPNGAVGASQSHTGHDHSSQRNNSRRGGYGARPRGDSSYHTNHGGRRDQDRREVHPPPPQYMPPTMGYMPPPPLPPGAGPYMAAPPMRVFPGPPPQMGFDMTSPFIYVSPMAPPMVPPLAPMIFPPQNPLTSRIVKQIDFYFSDDNLPKDGFLKENMDDNGWVPIALIANFPRVQQLTNDIPLILDSLRYSTVVEVQGDKIRRRSGWSKWVSSSSGSRTPSSPPENVATNSNGNADAREDH